MPYPTKFEHWKNGVVSFPDILRKKLHLTDIQQIQVACTLADINYINIEGLRDFLGTLSYPIYHLDFETMQPVIPPYDGTRPYQQIPFQYSLHIEHADDKALEHREFLGDSVSDPRRALAEQLCHDIPSDACVMAYNKSFECTRLSELAAAFPDDPTLNYHNLSGSVHNGGEAMDIYPRITQMTPDEQLAARESLLHYCELDTLAMVKVLGKIREFAK